MIFGVGRSGFPRTYQAYDVSYAESRDRFTEVLEILKRAWTESSSPSTANATTSATVSGVEAVRKSRIRRSASR